VPDWFKAARAKARKNVGSRPTPSVTRSRYAEAAATARFACVAPVRGADQGGAYPAFMFDEFVATLGDGAELDEGLLAVPAPLAMAAEGSGLAAFFNRVQLEASGAELSVSSLANDAAGLPQVVRRRTATLLSTPCRSSRYSHSVILSFSPIRTACPSP